MYSADSFNKIALSWTDLVILFFMVFSDTFLRIILAADYIL
jgi:hypothetical protein